MVCVLCVCACVTRRVWRAPARRTCCCQEDDDDTLSVYVFGEEEERLQQEAVENGGYLSHEHIQQHFGRPQVQKVRRVIRVASYCRSLSGSTVELNVLSLFS